jgi:hypothetical protein
MIIVNSSLQQNMCQPMLEALLGRGNKGAEPSAAPCVALRQVSIPRSAPSLFPMSSRRATIVDRAIADMLHCKDAASVAGRGQSKDGRRRRTPAIDATERQA